MTASQKRGAVAAHLSRQLHNDAGAAVVAAVGEQRERCRARHTAVLSAPVDAAGDSASPGSADAPSVGGALEVASHAAVPRQSNGQFDDRGVPSCAEIETSPSWLRQLLTVSEQAACGAGPAGHGAWQSCSLGIAAAAAKVQRDTGLHSGSGHCKASDWPLETTGAVSERLAAWASNPAHPNHREADPSPAAACLQPHGSSADEWWACMALPAAQQQQRQAPHPQACARTALVGAAQAPKHGHSAALHSTAPRLSRSCEQLQSQASAAGFAQPAHVSSAQGEFQHSVPSGAAERSEAPFGHTTARWDMQPCFDMTILPPSANALPGTQPAYLCVPSCWPPAAAAALHGQTHNSAQWHANAAFSATATASALTASLLTPAQRTALLSSTAAAPPAFVALEPSQAVWHANPYYALTGRSTGYLAPQHMLGESAADALAVRTLHVTAPVASRAAGPRPEHAAMQPLQYLEAPSGHVGTIGAAWQHGTVAAGASTLRGTAVPLRLTNAGRARVGSLTSAHGPHLGTALPQTSAGTYGLKQGSTEHANAACEMPVILAHVAQPRWEAVNGGAAGASKATLQRGQPGPAEHGVLGAVGVKCSKASPALDSPCQHKLANVGNAPAVSGLLGAIRPATEEPLRHTAASAAGAPGSGELHMRNMTLPACKAVGPATSMPGVQSAAASQHLSLESLGSQCEGFAAEEPPNQTPGPIRHRPGLMHGAQQRGVDHEHSSVTAGAWCGVAAGAGGGANASTDAVPALAAHGVQTGAATAYGVHTPLLVPARTAGSVAATAARVRAIVRGAPVLSSSWPQVDTAAGERRRCVEVNEWLSGSTIARLFEGHQEARRQRGLHAVQRGLLDGGASGVAPPAQQGNR